MDKIIVFLDRDGIISVVKIEDGCFKSLSDEVKKNNGRYYYSDIHDISFDDFLSAVSHYIEDFEFVIVDCGATMALRRKVEKVLKKKTNQVTCVYLHQAISLYVMWKKELSKKGKSIRIHFGQRFYDAYLNRFGVVEVRKSPYAKNNVLELSEEEFCFFLCPENLFLCRENLNDKQADQQSEQEFRILKEKLEEESFERQLQIDSQAIELEHLREELAKLKASSLSSPLSGFSFTPGSIVRFGSLRDQKIDWIVLERKASQALLLCRTGFDTSDFEDCPALHGESPLEGSFTGRLLDPLVWLDNTLLPFLFSVEEQGYIIPRELFSHDKRSKERIFLLSKSEADSYLRTNPSLCSLFDKRPDWFWLINLGDYNSFTRDKEYQIGSVHEEFRLKRGLACRPALWVSI